MAQDMFMDYRRMEKQYFCCRFGNKQKQNNNNNNNSKTELKGQFYYTKFCKW